MPPSNQDLFEIKTKISYLEKHIEEILSDSKSNSEEFSKLKEKLELIKYNFINKQDISLIEEDLDKLNSKINSIEMELPEFRLVKKLILGMIAFILTAFLGLIWNTTISPKNKTDVVMDEVAKRIAEEYRKNGQPK